VSWAGLAISRRQTSRPTYYRPASRQVPYSVRHIAYLGPDRLSLVNGCGTDPTAARGYLVPTWFRLSAISSAHTDRPSPGSARQEFIRLTPSPFWHPPSQMGIAHVCLADLSRSWAGVISPGPVPTDRSNALPGLLFYRTHGRTTIVPRIHCVAFTSIPIPHVLSTMVGV
jgi:hypothetical protein